MADGEHYEVKVATTPTTGFIGVAGYSVADGAQVQVLGPKNIVRCQIQTASKCNYGDDLMISGAFGRLSNTGLTYGNKVGVALETQATASGSAVVLLT